MKPLISMPKNTSYFSAIDYGHFAPNDYEQRAFEEFFFRRCTSIDETFFFIKTPFKRHLMQPNSIELWWLKAGLIVPLVKRFDISSFTDLVDKFNDYVVHSGSLDQMSETAEYLDQSLYQSGLVRYAKLDAHKAQMFDQNVANFLLGERPRASLGSIDRLIEEDWRSTQALREEWLPVAFERAEKHGLLGIARSEIIRVACDKHKVQVTYDLTALRQLVGPDVIKLVEWMNDIYWYSRGEAVGGETSFHVAEGGYSLGPHLRPIKSSNVKPKIVAANISLPTMAALRTADAGKLLSARLNEGESFLNALALWAQTPQLETEGTLTRSLHTYCAALRKAAEEAMPTTFGEVAFKFVSGPSRTALATAYGFLAGGAALAIPQVSTALAVSSTILAAPVTGYMLIRALRHKTASHRFQVNTAFGMKIDT